jgi:hypothetical protein
MNKILNPNVFGNNANEYKLLNYNFIVPIESNFSNRIKQNLEIEKLNTKIDLNKQVVYLQKELNELSSYNEKENQASLISLIEIKDQIAYSFSEINPDSYTYKTDNYIIEMLKKKNNSVLAEIEAEWQINNFLTNETENTLYVETWMMDDKVWSGINENGMLNQYQVTYVSNNDNNITNVSKMAGYLVPETEDALRLEPWLTNMIQSDPIERRRLKNEFLESLVISKNAEVLAEIELERKLRDYLVLEVEDYLEIENWMIESKCWCTDKKENNYVFKDSFAFFK